MLVCVVTRSDAYPLKKTGNLSQPAMILSSNQKRVDWNAQRPDGQCRVNGQGCLQFGCMGPLWRGRCTKVSDESAKLIKFPMIEDSAVDFECGCHGTSRVLGIAPMNTLDIAVGRVIAIHIKHQGSDGCQAWNLQDGSDCSVRILLAYSSETDMRCDNRWNIWAYTGWSRRN